jgi:hypothetical protein
MKKLVFALMFGGFMSSAFITTQDTEKKEANVKLEKSNITLVKKGPTDKWRAYATLEVEHKNGEKRSILGHAGCVSTDGKGGTTMRRMPKMLQEKRLKEK